MRPHTTDCPYCGEGIRARARKCKHCGEWLDGLAQPPPAHLERNEARAVSRGLKQKELHDSVLKMYHFLSLAAGIAVGFLFQSVWLGIGVALVCAVLATSWYYKS